MGYGALLDRTCSSKSRDGCEAAAGAAAADPAALSAVGDSAPPPAAPLAKLPRSLLLPALPEGFGAVSSSRDVLCGH